MVKADDFRSSVLVGEVAPHGVTHLLAQLFTGLGLGEDRVADGLSGEAAVGVLLDDEDDFGVH